QPVSPMILVLRKDPGDRLLPQPSKRSGIDDPVPVALERSSIIERPPLVLDRESTGCPGSPEGEGRKTPVFRRFQGTAHRSRHRARDATPRLESAPRGL